MMYRKDEEDYEDDEFAGQKSECVEDKKSLKKLAMMSDLEKIVSQAENIYLLMK